MRLWLLLLVLFSVLTATLSQVWVDVESDSGALSQLEDADDADDDWAFEEPSQLVPVRLDLSADSGSIPQWLFVTGLDRPPCVRAS